MNNAENWIVEAEASRAAQAAQTTQAAPTQAPANTAPANTERDTPGGDRPLNAQQMRFIDEYRRGGERNAAAAYLRAGYECASMSIASAAASRLLKQVNVKAELKRRHDEDRRLARMSEEQFKAEIMRRFMARPADYIDLETGQLRKGLTADDLAAISEFEIKTEHTLTGEIVTVKTKTESRAKYAELAMRLNGWGNDNLNLNVTTPQPVADDVPDITLDALPGLLSGLPPDVLGSLISTAQSIQPGDGEQDEANAKEQSKEENNT